MRTKRDYIDGAARALVQETRAYNNYFAYTGLFERLGAWSEAQWWGDVATCYVSLGSNEMLKERGYNVGEV
jgi:hypothetical protein